MMNENMKQELREVLFQIELLKRKRVQEFLLRIGLTPGQGQARILVFLVSHPSVTQREIADACMLDVTTMSRTLDKLEKQGLILRKRDPGCRRSYQISLTAEGRKKAEEANTEFSELEEVLCAGFQEKEIKKLTGQLRKMRENLCSFPCGIPRGEEDRPKIRKMNDLENKISK